MTSMLRAGLVLVAAGIAFCGSPAGACTVVSLADDQGIVFAANEDGGDPEARLWYAVAQEGAHGGVYLGLADGFRQAGMNDAGLCFDITACPRMDLQSRQDRVDPSGNLIDEAMATCTSVAEAEELFGRYNLRGFERVQVIFADAAGASAVFDCNHVTRGSPEGIVATNFYLAAPELGRYPCGRHEIAQEMLKGTPATVAGARSILSAVRQEGRSQTQYSYVCDPRSRRMTLYRFHDFEQSVRIDLAAELGGNDREVTLADLFPRRNHAAEAWQAKIDRSLSHVFLRTAAEQGLEAAVEEYHTTRINHSEILNELAALGFEFQGDGDHAAAAVVFGLMTEDFPTFARGYEWLGNALVRTEDLAGAADAYRRCLELAPDNRNAHSVLEQIEAQG